MKCAELLAKLEENPVIAAVKNEEGLERCIECESTVVFDLYGTINTVPEITGKLKAANKTVFAHIDLIEGLSLKEAAVDYLREHTRIDGIISTRPQIIKYAKSLGLLAVQRFFVLDSLALENIRRADIPDGADMVEILPGLMPKIIRRLCAELSKPVIAGGLISDKEDIITALTAGARAISSTNNNVWFM